MTDCITAAHPDDALDIRLKLGGALLSFDFVRHSATANRVGQDLVFTMNNADELKLEGFFVNLDDRAHPFSPLRQFLKLRSQAYHPGESLGDFLLREDSDIFF